MNFGLQKKEREEKIAQMMKENGPIWKLDVNDVDLPVNGKNGVTNGSNGTNASNGVNGSASLVKPAPKMTDVIGASLKYVGTYKNLDNKKQVVALIDDVIISDSHFQVLRIN